GLGPTTGHSERRGQVGAAHVERVDHRVAGARGVVVPGQVAFELTPQRITGRETGGIGAVIRPPRLTSGLHQYRRRRAGASGGVAGRPVSDPRNRLAHDPTPSGSQIRLSLLCSTVQQSNTYSQDPEAATGRSSLEPHLRVYTSFHDASADQRRRLAPRGQ